MLDTDAVPDIVEAGSLSLSSQIILTFIAVAGGHQMMVPLLMDLEH